MALCVYAVQGTLGAGQDGLGGVGIGEHFEGLWASQKAVTGCHFMSMDTDNSQTVSNDQGV